MQISLVVAADLDGVIGKDGGLPWRLPADLRRFRAITMGKPIIMGRRTFESIGKPLDGRMNVVLTRSDTPLPEGVLRAGSVDEALRLAGTVEEVCVIGGGVVFAEALPIADRIYLTTVQAHLAGDTHFPRLDPAEWTEVSREDHDPDEKNALPFSFRVLERP
ncbi:MAG: dihydrofolate reductase [Chloroflexota bacterium]|nr:dihydrofolate reductase [Chloroflexota bacterium]